MARASSPSGNATKKKAWIRTLLRRRREPFRGEKFSGSLPPIPFRPTARGTVRRMPQEEWRRRQENKPPVIFSGKYQIWQVSVATSGKLNIFKNRRTGDWWGKVVLFTEKGELQFALRMDKGPDERPIKTRVSFGWRMQNMKNGRTDTVRAAAEQ